MLNQKARGKFPSLISEKKVKDIRLVLHLFILYHTLTQLASIQFVKYEFFSLGNPLNFNIFKH